MIGQRISPILEEIETSLWKFEENYGVKPCYTNNGFRAAAKIFMSALMDRMWELQQQEKMDMTDRENMAEKAGEALRALIKTYTNIDSHEFYTNVNKLKQ